MKIQKIVQLLLLVMIASSESIYTMLTRTMPNQASRRVFRNAQGQFTSPSWKSQPRNELGQFISPDEAARKEVEERVKREAVKAVRETMNKKSVERQGHILQEAQRLGLEVPGMPKPKTVSDLWTPGQPQLPSTQITHPGQQGIGWHSISMPGQPAPLQKVPTVKGKTTVTGTKIPTGQPKVQHHYDIAHQGPVQVGQFGKKPLKTYKYPQPTEGLFKAGGKAGPRGLSTAEKVVLGTGFGIPGGLGGYAAYEAATAKAETTANTLKFQTPGVIEKQSETIKDEVEKAEEIVKKDPTLRERFDNFILQLIELINIEILRILNTTTLGFRFKESVKSTEKLVNWLEGKLSQKAIEKAFEKGYLKNQNSPMFRKDPISRAEDKHYIAQHGNPIKDKKEAQKFYDTYLKDKKTFDSLFNLLDNVETRVALQAFSDYNAEHGLMYENYEISPSLKAQQAIRAKVGTGRVTMPARAR